MSFTGEKDESLDRFLRNHAETARVFRHYAWRPWERLPEEYRIGDDPYQ